MSGLTFAVPDLHGRLDLLEQALAAVGRYGRDAEVRTIVFLGDYIDRGPESSATLARLIAGPPVGQRWVCLKGNHESMMSLALGDAANLDWWIGNGGDRTLESYRGRKDQLGPHLAWIDALPTLHTDAHRVYVHAGVDPAVPLDRQAEDTLIWKRYPIDADEGHGRLHVVHGHDPKIDGPLLHTGRTDLDTYAWRTGRLVVGVFKDETPGGPVDLIEIKGAPS